MGGDFFETMRWPRDPTIKEAAIRSNIARVPQKPVILASGTSISPFIIQSGRLLGDNQPDFDGKTGFEQALDNFQLNGLGMRTYATARLSNDTFNSVIERLAKATEELFRQHNGYTGFGVSGGMRSDVPFAAAVAHKMRVPLAIVYKPNEDGKTIEIFGHQNTNSATSREGMLYVHIADTVTRGSSIARIEDGELAGWVPSIRKAGGQVYDCIAVVDRNQGAQRHLREQGIRLHSPLEVNKQLLKELVPSEHLDDVLAYVEAPRKWTETFLKGHEGPVEFLLPYFDTQGPEAKNTNRIREFMREYGGFLKNTCHNGSPIMQTLEAAVIKRHGQDTMEQLMYR